MTSLISSLHMHADISILFFTCKFAQMLIYSQANKCVCVFVSMQFIISVLDCIYILNAFNIYVTYFNEFVHKRIYVLLCLGTSKCVMLKKILPTVSCKLQNVSNQRRK